MSILESKNVGRALGVGTGATLGYLVNRIQKERQPPDLIGLFLKSSACYFLGQYAVDTENEVLLRSVLGYISYEGVRSSPLGKPPAETSGTMGSFTQAETQLVPYNYQPYQNPHTSSLGEVLTPENLQNVGAALRGLSSFFNGFNGPKPK